VAIGRCQRRFTFGYSYVATQGLFWRTTSKTSCFINNGDGLYRAGEAFGLADQGFSTCRFIFDYDKTETLDVYLAHNNRLTSGHRTRSIRCQMKVPKRVCCGRDKLFRRRTTLTMSARGAGIYGSYRLLDWKSPLSMSIRTLGRDILFSKLVFRKKDYSIFNNQDGTLTESLGNFHCARSRRHSMGAISQISMGIIGFFRHGLLPELLTG